MKVQSRRVQPGPNVRLLRREELRRGQREASKQTFRNDRIKDSLRRSNYLCNHTKQMKSKPKLNGTYRTIIDSGSQITLLGKGWKVTRKFSETTVFTGYGGVPNKAHRVNAIGALVPLEGDGKPTCIVAVHSAYKTNQDLSLLNPDHMEYSNVEVDIRGEVFGGGQHLKGPDFEIKLEHNINDTFKGFYVRQPTMEEQGSLPRYDLTGDFEFHGVRNLDLSLLLVNHTATHRKGMQHRWTKELRTDWRKRLGYVSDNVIRNTFKATTQKAPNIENENRDIPRVQYKSQHPWSRPKALGEDCYCDFVYDKRKDQKSGKLLGVLFFFATSKRAKFYPLKKKNQAKDLLKQLVRDVGAPREMYSDKDSNLCDGEAFITECWQQGRFKAKPTPPGSPWKNFVERWNSVIWDMALSQLERHDGSHKLINESLEHACYLNDYMGWESLNGSCPLEVQSGETQDISHLRFHFNEPIWYYDNTAPGLSRDHRMKPGFFIGMADTVGDKFSYKILTAPMKGKRKRTNKSETERPAVLTRTIVCRRNTADRIYPGGRNNPKVKFPQLRPQSVSPFGGDEDHYSSSDESNGSPAKTPDRKRARTKGKAKDPEDENGVEEDPPLMQQDDMTTHDPESGEPPDPAPDPTSPNPTTETERVDRDIEAALRNAFDDDVDSHIKAIKRHRLRNGVLTFYVQGPLGGECFMVPYEDMKIDFPALTARYILNNRVGEKAKSGPSKDCIRWAKEYAEAHNCRVRTQKRVNHVTSGDTVFPDYSAPVYDSDDEIDINPPRKSPRVNFVTTRKRKAGRNRKGRSPMGTAKYGVLIPKNVDQALSLDTANGDNLWAEAIKKEMQALMDMKVFRPVKDKGKEIFSNDSFQFAPLRMIFDIKHDLRRKARLVIGGHVIDTSEYDTYASNMKTVSARVLLLIAKANGLDIMSSDISNAYLYAKCDMDVYTRCGKEFAGFEGYEVGGLCIIQRALYGLGTSARCWHDMLADTLRGMDYFPSRFDSDVWMRKAEGGKSYEYLGVHTDDLLIISKDPDKMIKEIEEVFHLKGTAAPTHHLGCDYRISSYGKPGGGRKEFLEIGTKSYVTEVLIKVEKMIKDLKIPEAEEYQSEISNGLPLGIKEPLPVSKKGSSSSQRVQNYRPELDNSPYLLTDGHRVFQGLIGIATWLITLGRFDFHHSITSLNRFSAAPRVNHLRLLIRVFGYIKRYPEVWLRIDPSDHGIGEKCEEVEISDSKALVKAWNKIYGTVGEDLGDLREEIDPKAPEPLMKELTTHAFFDANHAHDIVTGRSVTGILIFIGCTPVLWYCKRQGSVQNSTYGAEYIAGRTCVEEVKSIRHALRSFGVKVTKSTLMLGDNKSMVTTSNHMKTDENKKCVHVSQMYIREAIADGSVEVHKVGTKHNKADGFTKDLCHQDFHECFFRGSPGRPPLYKGSDVNNGGGKKRKHGSN